jgi:hypothetical protein
MPDKIDLQVATPRPLVANVFSGSLPAPPSTRRSVLRQSVRIRTGYAGLKTSYREMWINLTYEALPENLYTSQLRCVSSSVASGAP